MISHKIDKFLCCILNSHLHILRLLLQVKVAKAVFSYLLKNFKFLRDFWFFEFFTEMIFELGFWCIDGWECSLCERGGGGWFDQLLLHLILLCNLYFYTFFGFFEKIFVSRGRSVWEYFGNIKLFLSVFLLEREGSGLQWMVL